MSMLWTICGAARGVGKTHLATELARLLPRSVYAKCGCGSYQAGKCVNFFQSQEQLDAFIEAARRRMRHVVVESNSLARTGRADVTIFVDAAGQDDLRSDARDLCTAADMRICRGVPIRQWQTALRGKALPASLCDAICDLFVDQKRYLCSRGLEVRTKLWFEVADSHVFGAGLADLLENVDRCGTLQAAAKQVRMSYRHAWDMIAKAEKHLGRKLILRHPGGRGGGGSALSAEGRRLLSVFRRLGGEVASFADDRFAILCAKERANA